MGYFGQLGATTLEPAIPSTATFTSLARQQLVAMSAPGAYALASATYEATAPAVRVFALKPDRDAAYNALLANPGDTAWIAKLDKDAVGDWISGAVRKLTVTTVTTRRTDWKNQIPWVIGGAAVIAAALYFTPREAFPGAPVCAPQAVLAPAHHHHLEVVVQAIYSPESYQLGADGNAPVTRAQALKAQAELRRMRGSLNRWLEYRLRNDAGNTAAYSAALAPWRQKGEQALATQLHTLLSEVFDGQGLPDPDVSHDPNAAVSLAAIAISGKLPGDRAAPPGAIGAIPWLWPAVIIVGAIAFVITTQIRSSADQEAEREKYECIKAGKCTDSGFWLKLGAIAFIGWLIWDKAGVGRRLMGGSAAK